MSELVHDVNGVLSRADTLFGSADGSGSATAADQLTTAVAAIRSGQEHAATMSAHAIANYAAFAQGSRDALEQLSSVESQLAHRLHEAAQAVSTAKAASQSARNIAASAADALAELPDSPAAEAAVITALRTQVGNELELIHTLQAAATELGERLHALDY